MPVTRSRSKTAAEHPVAKPPKPGRKRRAASDEAAEPSAENPTPQKKTRMEKQPVANAQPAGTAAVPDDPGPPPVLVPAELAFSFEEAKQHLIAADSRFQDVFDIAICTPYQNLDRIEPFR